MFPMDVICIGPLIYVWIFSHFDPTFLAVGLNGYRSNFPSTNPVQRGAVDSCDWPNFESASMSPLVVMEARCQSPWCEGCYTCDLQEMSDSRIWGFPLQQLGSCNTESSRRDQTSLHSITCPCFPEMMHLSVSMRIVRPFEASWGTEMGFLSSRGTCTTILQMT